MCHKKQILTTVLGLILLAVLPACGVFGIQPSGGADLNGTTWVLVSLNGNPPVAGSNIRLHFGAG